MDPDAENPTPTDESESALGELLVSEDLRSIGLQVWEWIRDSLLTVEVALQVGLVAGALVPAVLFGPRLKSLISSQLTKRMPHESLKRICDAAAIIATPIALYISLTIFRVALGSTGSPVQIIEAAISLLTAWIVIRLVTLVIRSPFWSRVAFYVAWPIAALDAFGVLDDVVQQMQALAIPIGESDSGQTVDISLFDIVRALAYFGALFWGASFLGSILQKQIENVEELTPSLKALIVKIINVALPVVALLIALQLVGFNLATLAIFSGAVGLGIGLGLQKLVANFIAGFTLIADKSIKPNDVIEINDTFGWVTSMQARYVALRTRDGTEHLIPNDNFITDGVINWSRSDKVVRLHAPFGVSYSTRDLRKIKELAQEVAVTVDRVVERPAPMCNVMEFGDSSVNFDLRFWITDPSNGMANVRSEVYLALWDALHEHNVEIPFPQRDLHVKSWPSEMKEEATRDAPTITEAAAS